MIEIKNAIIESVTLDNADRGFLTAWLKFNYGGSVQEFGGYSLYLPKSFRHHCMLSHAGHFIWRCMEIGGVTSWNNLKGKTIRVKITDGLIEGIGHIVKDDWFFPKDDFSEDQKK